MFFDLHDLSTTLTGKVKYERPWGYFVNLLEGDGFKNKIIVVNPLARLSLQKHFKRSEVWITISGSGLAITDGIAYPLQELSSVVIQKQAWHRLINTSQENLLVIHETQIGICEEDDIERQQDDYGRIT